MTSPVLEVAWLTKCNHECRFLPPCLDLHAVDFLMSVQLIEILHYFWPSCIRFKVTALSSPFLSFRSDVLNLKDDFTEFMNKKNACWHRKILFFFFFAQRNFSNSHSLQVFFNKCWSCKREGSAEKTQDCSANKHINYLLKHDGGGNQISWLQRHNFRSSRRGRRQDEQKGSSILMRRSFRRAWCEYTRAAGVEADVLMFL